MSGPSPYDLNRNAAAMHKSGSVEDGTDAAHIVSLEVASSILQNSKLFFPVVKRNEIVKCLNEPDNLRLKTAGGNRGTDRVIDAEIMEALRDPNPKPLSQAASDRARRQIEIICSSGGGKGLPERFIEAAKTQYSKLVDNDGHKIARSNKAVDSSYKPVSEGGNTRQPSQGARAGVEAREDAKQDSAAHMIDMRSSLIRSGDLKFRSDGSIDERCKAVKDGLVRVTQDGNLDLRSSAVQSGHILLVGSQADDGSLASLFGRVSLDTDEAAVDHRSSYVRNGDLMFRSDGQVDGRSAAVRSGDVLLTKSGEVDGRSAAVRSGDVSYKPSAASSSSAAAAAPVPAVAVAPPAPPPASAQIDHRSSYVRSGDLMFRSDGQVDGRSAAVRSGDVLLTKSGEIDGRSAAVRSGEISYKPSAASSSSYSSSYSSSSSSSGSSGVFTGPRGGQYTYSSSGSKVYLSSRK